MIRTQPAAWLVVALAIVISACGGNNSPTSPSGSSGSTTQLYTVTGTVRSAAGGVVTNATVRALDGRNAGKSAATNASGQYTLGGLVLEGFNIEASAPDYAAAAKGAPITAGTPSATVDWNLLPAQLWTNGGVGDTVFTMPAYFGRVQIVGIPSTSCQNFIVHIGGQFKVNVILGTCSVADARTYDGIVTTTGGTVEIVSSTGVNWSFTEVR